MPKDVIRAQKGFVQAIHENPRDDAVLLIYADWLEDQDNPALRDCGQFIRVQYSLAELSKDEPYRKTLRKSELALLRKFGDGWLGKVPLRFRFEGYYSGFPSIRSKYRFRQADLLKPWQEDALLRSASSHR